MRRLVGGRVVARALAGCVVITRFDGAHRFLSNFQPCRVVLDNVEYPSVEHAYQAAKTLDLTARAFIASQTSPGRAKRAGRQVPMRDDWERVKLAVMLDLLRQKFAHADLRAQLIATSDDVLVEGNTWGDTFWGMCNGVGLNHLGRLLMQVRAEVRT